MRHGHPASAPAATAPVDWAKALSLGARRMNPAPGFLALASRPDIISFAGGVPDPAVFPVEAIGQACQRILDDPALRGQALQYAPSAGYGPLREWVARYMSARGVHRPADRLIITSGAQQALDLAAKLLIDPQDTIAVTAPTFFAALDTFNAYRPRYETIGFGIGGLAMDEAQAVLRRRPKFLYVVPDFQNPTGLSLSLAEREQLLASCAEHGVPILEDAAYEALRFRGAALPSLASLAQRRGLDDLVLYAGTFSKTIAPGLRVGWLSASEPLIGKLQALKLAADVHTSVLHQMVVLELAQAGMQAHVTLLRHTYETRCAAMLGALDRHMPPGVSWSRPDGGLFVWLELPPSIDAAALLPRAIESAKVAYVPGSLSFADGRGAAACRLSFATASEQRIQEGVQRLGALFSEVLSAQARSLT